MIEFDWYIKRAKIDLKLFFEVENIKSDEDLAEYCRSKNLSLPREKYCLEKKEETVETQLVEDEKIASEDKPKRNRKKPLEKAEDEADSVPEVKEEKPARKPRRRTTRKKAAPK